MRLERADGTAVYYNIVKKRGKLRYIIKAASGQVIPGRDRQKHASRTFTQKHQAERFLQAQGYTIPR